MWISILYLFFNDNDILEVVDKEKKFKNKDKIYVNYYVNITEKHTIKVKIDKGDDNGNKDKMPNWAVLLITLLSLGILLTFIFVLIIYIKLKKKGVADDERAEQLNQL